MGIKKHILIILIIGGILVGCTANSENQINFSEQLIYGEPEEIDLVQLDYALEESVIAFIENLEK